MRMHQVDGLAISCATRTVPRIDPRNPSAFQSTHFCKTSADLDARSATTSADDMDAYLERSFAFSHSKNLMPSLVYGARPKWQYAALSWYLGWRSASDTAKAPGRQSKLILTMLVMSSGVREPCWVP